MTRTEPVPVPADASGLVFVRQNDSVVHLDQQGQAHYTGYRIKILHPNALQIGNVSVVWNPAAGKPTVHVVRIHRENQPIDVLKSASFEILRREDQLEAAHLDGLLTAILRVPDLRVGDELEVALTIPENDPTLKTANAGLVALDSQPAPGRFRMELNWVKGEEPHLKMSPDMAAVAKRRERAVIFDFHNPGVLSPPNGAPPRYKWQRVVEYSDFSDWAALSRHFAPLFSKAAEFKVNSLLQNEAKRVAAANPGPLARASAALKLVQEKVRYIYVGLNGGNLTPASADETWERRYGDCKGKTALLLGLLSELGIKAEPVLVNNSNADDGLDARLPNPGLFDHVLVRAEIDGVHYWLDGTMPPVASPSPEPIIPYRWVLPLSVQGKSLERLEWRTSDRPDEVTLHEIDARAGFDVPAKITNTTIVRGIKGLQEYVLFSALTPAQLLSGFREKLVGDTWQSIEDVRWRYDPTARASVLTISGRGAVEWQNEDGGGKSYRLPGGGFNPPAKRVRAAEQDQQVPFYNDDSQFTCHVTTVRLPSATKPEHWSFNTSFDARLFGRNYYRAFGQRDGTINMIRGSRVEQLEIPEAAAKRDNERIASFDNSMAVITYDPTSRSDSVSSAYVPATYEIDWTDSEVPCLATTAARLNRLRQVVSKAD